MVDLFDTDFIDPVEWVISQQGGPVHREYVREIHSGRLRMVDRAYGNTNSDTGGNFDGIFTDFPNPDVVTAVGADVRVKSFEATFCAANPTIASTRAELHGTFYNVATPVPGSHTDDVRASIRLQRGANALDPPDERCPDRRGRRIELDRSGDSGSVVDFLNVGIGPIRTGVFNVADMAIITGAVLLVLVGFQRTDEQNAIGNSDGTASNTVCSRRRQARL